MRSISRSVIAAIFGALFLSRTGASSQRELRFLFAAIVIDAARGPTGDSRQRSL
jgi:hypothetical protein